MPALVDRARSLGATSDAADDRQGDISADPSAAPARRNKRPRDDGRDDTDASEAACPIAPSTQRQSMRQPLPPAPNATEPVVAPIEPRNPPTARLSLRQSPVDRPPAGAIAYLAPRRLPPTPPAPVDRPAKRRKHAETVFYDPLCPRLALRKRRDGSVSAQTVRTLMAAVALKARCKAEICDCYVHAEKLLEVRLSHLTAGAYRTDRLH